MRHIIFQPEVGEAIPTGSMYYTLPVFGNVVSSQVADDFKTGGLVIYDSLNGINDLENLETVPYFSGFPIITEFIPPGGV